VLVGVLTGCSTTRLLGEQPVAERLDVPDETTTSLVPDLTLFAVGDRVETDDGGSLRVVSYTQPVTAPSPDLVAQPGEVLAVVEVEACAGPAGGGRVSPLDFELHLADGGRRQADFAVKQPALRRVGLAAPGACAGGYVTFQVPWDERPTSIAAVTDPLARWAVG
jgi:hypothetical protein